MKVFDKLKNLFGGKKKEKDARLEELYAARTKAIEDYENTPKGTKDSAIAANNIRLIEQTIAMSTKNNITIKDIIGWVFAALGIGSTIYGIRASYYATKAQKDTNQQIIDIEAESCGYVRSTALNTKYNNKVAK